MRGKGFENVGGVRQKRHVFTDQLVIIQHHVIAEKRGPEQRHDDQREPKIGAPSFEKQVVNHSIPGIILPPPAGRPLSPIARHPPATV